MKSLVLKADRVLRFEEHEPPEAPGWARVRVAFAGICGSDLGRAFRGGAYHYPLVMGHEFSGVVLRPGSGNRVRPGDRAAVYPLLPCGRCPACLEGNPQLCSDYDYFGSRRDGGFTGELSVPEENLVPVPPDVSLEEAALCEPAAVAHHAVARLGIRPGNRAAVWGAGPVGLLAAQWLRIFGCSEVTLIDIDAGKLQLAESLGFATGQPAAPPDCCVEACGLAETRTQALAAAGRQGKILFIGNAAGDWTVTAKQFSGMLRREQTLFGTWNSTIAKDWTAVLDRCAAGELRLAPLISGIEPLGSGREVFEAIAAGRMRGCKFLLRP